MADYTYLDELTIDGKRRKLDDIQKEVCTNEKNAVAAAGAGSGKTQVLATRFAWLVMSRGIDVSRILTLTFTKKAAGEMYERIYKTLHFFAYESTQLPPDAEERKRAVEALNKFSSSHIQTLDSYCSDLVKQAAASYGIKPDFSCGASDSAKEIRDAALPFIMARTETRPSIKHYADTGKVSDFATKTFAKIIEKYATIANDADFFESKLPVQLEIIKNLWNYLVCGVENARPDFLPFDAQYDFNCVRPLKERVGELLDAIDAAEAEDKIDYSKETYKPLFDFKKMAAEFDFGKYPTINSAEEIPEFVEKNQGIIESLLEFCFECQASLSGRMSSIRGNIYVIKGNEDKQIPGTLEYLVPVLRYLYGREYDYAKDFLSLLDEFSTNQNETKRKTGNLTFADVSSLALRILKENKKIRAQEKAAFDRIMIDEFQDNNDDNRVLLFLISEKKFESLLDGGNFGCKDGVPSADDLEPEKLFFVGDEKQSIYKFRGADVSTFNKLKKDFSKTELTPMYYNYRSDNELISAFNRIFGGAQSKIFDNVSAEKGYEAQYTTPAQHYKVVNDEGGAEKSGPEDLVEITAENTRIHLAMLNKDLLKKEKKSDDASSSGAPDGQNDSDEESPEVKDIIYSYVARQIWEIKEKAVASGDGFKYSSIAILDKSRTNRKYIAKWLNSYGIPFVLDQNSELFADGPINDIYNILRLCVYPNDRLAYAAFLASPYAGLSENSVETVLAGGELSDEGENSNEKNKLHAAHAFLEEIKKSALGNPLASTISKLWYDRGYYYETLLNKTARQQSESFDLIFELARQADENGKSLPWFVDQLALIKADEKSSFSSSQIDMDSSDVSYPLEKEDGVQVMTIHKSKGLQFDHVFVMGCTGVSNKGDKDNYYYNKQTGLSLKYGDEKVNIFKIINKEIEKNQEVAEYRRVLYVAITRAIKDVYICGPWTLTKDSNKGIVSDDKEFHLVERMLRLYYPQCEGDVEFGVNGLAKSEGLDGGQAAGENAGAAAGGGLTGVDGAVVAGDARAAGAADGVPETAASAESDSSDDLHFTFNPDTSAPFDFLGLNPTPYLAQPRPDTSKAAFAAMEKIFSKDQDGMADATVSLPESKILRLGPSELENDKVSSIKLTDQEIAAGKQYEKIEELMEKYCGSGRGEATGEKDGSVAKLGEHGGAVAATLTAGAQGTAAGENPEADNFELSDDYDYSEEAGGLRYIESSDLANDAFDEESALRDNLFHKGAFGTMVHSFLEASFKGTEPENYEIPVGAWKNVENEDDRKTFRELCIKMTKGFSASEEGRASIAAKKAGRLAKAEWNFKTVVDEDCLADGEKVKAGVYTGSIDLIYQNQDGTYTIVDYKTDQKVKPQKYFAQQYVYRLAAARLLGIADEEASQKIKCKLYFLRYGKVVEILG